MLSRLNEPFENSEEFRFPEAAIRSPDACKQFHRNEKISGSVRLADALSDLRFNARSGFSSGENPEKPAFFVERGLVPGQRKWYNLS